MAIQDERTGTLGHLRDGRYHRAALLADPRAKHLAAPVKTFEEALKARYDARLERENDRIEKLAMLVRTDYELDELVRLVELEVLGRVGKEREDTRYQSVFPHGLTALVALRGEEEARAVGAMVKELEKHFPEVAERHKAELLAQAEACVVAEKAWLQAETDAAQAMALEVVGRSELVRQLRKNEGALLTLYPGQKRRVRSYYRPRPKRRGGEGEGEE